MCQTVAFAAAAVERAERFDATAAVSGRAAQEGAHPIFGCFRLRAALETIQGIHKNGEIPLAVRVVRCHKLYKRRLTLEGLKEMSKWCDETTQCVHDINKAM